MHKNNFELYILTKLEGAIFAIYLKGSNTNLPATTLNPFGPAIESNKSLDSFATLQDVFVSWSKNNDYHDNMKYDNADSELEDKIAEVHTSPVQIYVKTITEARNYLQLTLQEMCCLNYWQRQQDWFLQLFSIITVSFHRLDLWKKHLDKNSR